MKMIFQTNGSDSVAENPSNVTQPNSRNFRETKTINTPYRTSLLKTFFPPKHTILRYLGLLQRSMVFGSGSTRCVWSSCIGASINANIGIMLGARAVLDCLLTAMRNNGSIAIIRCEYIIFTGQC